MGQIKVSMAVPGSLAGGIWCVGQDMTTQTLNPDGRRDLTGPRRVALCWLDKID